MDLKMINILVFAYLGDTIYEDYIRKHLILQGISNVDKLQKEATNYVSARAQASFLRLLQDNHFFTVEEEDIIRRARNAKNKSHPKGCDILTYKHATALEAVIGYLELKKDYSRINEIMKHILGGNVC